MKMPGKVIAVIVLLVLAIVIDGIAQAVSGKVETGFVVGVVIRGLLIFGLLKGSEGVRMLLKAFAWAGIFVSGLALILLLTAAYGVFPLAIVGALIGVASNGFVIFALADPGVQAWMFSRSVGGSI